jgi:hypothetical protein
MHDSEMWRTAETVRKLRPENNWCLQAEVRHPRFGSWLKSIMGFSQLPKLYPKTVIKTKS